MTRQERSHLEKCKHGMYTTTCAYCNPRPGAAKALGRSVSGTARKGLPDLTKDTLDAYVPLARERLIQIAREGRRVSYGEIMNEFGGRGHIGKVLYEVSKLEHGEGRPLLSVIVVQKSSGKPGDGFDKLVAEIFPSADPTSFWKGEQQKVWEYWSEH